MSIQKVGSDLVRAPESRELVRGASAAKPSASDDQASAGRLDRVEISAEGRELAAQPTADERQGLGRMALIRSRIETGFYDDRLIAGIVAERLLQSGDLAV